MSALNKYMILNCMLFIAKGKCITLHKLTEKSQYKNHKVK